MEFVVFLVFLLLPLSRSTFDLAFRKVIFAVEAAEIITTPRPQRPESGRFLWPSDLFNRKKDESQGSVLYINEERRGCGGVWDQPSAMKIMGGAESAPLAWPWMGAVFIISSSETTKNGRCGCTLISSKQAITAAHCLIARSGERVPKTHVLVLFGVHNLKQDRGEMFMVVDIHIHPNFQRKTHYNDVAILTFDRDVTREGLNREEMMPVCLPTTSMANESFVGEKGLVIGWGRLGMGSSLSAVLREVEIPIITNEECNEAYKKLISYSRHFPRGFTNSFICTIAPQGGKDACQGDSGGPMMIRRNYRWYLIGVISFGLGCGSPDYPGVYTRITTHMNWIQGIVRSRTVNFDSSDSQ